MQGAPGKTGWMARYAAWRALEILGVAMMTALLLATAWFASAVAVALWLLGADAAWPLALVALVTGLWLQRRIGRRPLEAGWRQLRNETAGGKL